MGKDDGGRAQSQGRAKDFPRLERGDIETSDSNALVADWLVAAIQVEDGKALPWAFAEILELEQRLTRRRDGGGRAVGRDVPPSRQLADGQQPPHLPRAKPMPTGRQSKVRRESLDDAPFGKQRPNSGQIPAMAEQAGEQTRFIRVYHLPIVPQICVYVHA